MIALEVGWLFLKLAAFSWVFSFVLGTLLWGVVYVQMKIADRSSDPIRQNPRAALIVAAQEIAIGMSQGFLVAAIITQSLSGGGLVVAVPVYALGVVAALPMPMLLGLFRLDDTEMTDFSPLGLFAAAIAYGAFCLMPGVIPDVVWTLTKVIAVDL